MQIKIVMQINCIIQNFMPYMMIYCLTHKLAQFDFRYMPFYEHFRKLYEKYKFK